MGKYIVNFNTHNLRINNFNNVDKNKNKILDGADINYNLIWNKYIDSKCLSEKKFIESKETESLKKLLKYIHKNTEKNIEIYEKIYGYKKINPIKVKNSSRLIIGHGEVSVREVSIKLDHIYGIPFIPASSIKGAFRNYLNEKYSNSYEKECPLITKIFGSETKKGEIIFLDIYPKEFHIGLDVMTPHYGKYYSNLVIPTDDMSPTPIKFPVIEKGAKFELTLLCKKNIYTLEENQKLNLNQSDSTNVGTLKSLDIQYEFNKFIYEKPLGAKTSVGYGYFEKIK